MPPARKSRVTRSPVFHWMCAAAFGVLEVAVLGGIVWCMVVRYGRPFAWARGFGLIAVYIALAVLMVRSYRMAQCGRPRPPWPYCSNCEYSLAGLSGVDRCPECGAAISPFAEDRGFTSLPRMPPER